MSGQLKYIMVDEIFPIIFTEAMTHKHIAGNKNVTSAGFVSISVDSEFNKKATAYGKSISLGKESKPEDSEIITAMFS